MAPSSKVYRKQKCYKIYLHTPNMYYFTIFTTLIYNQNDSNLWKGNQSNQLITFRLHCLIYGMEIYIFTMKTGFIESIIFLIPQNSFTTKKYNIGKSSMSTEIWSCCTWRFKNKANLFDVWRLIATYQWNKNKHIYVF